MGKDAYYFSHDSNARNDPKCASLIQQSGMEGYGLYWSLVEMLHEQKGGKLEKFPGLIGGIAFQFHMTIEATSKQIEALVKQHFLLREDEKYLWSDRVLRNLEERKGKHVAKVEAGKQGGIKSGETRRLAKQNEAVLEANEAVLEANEAVLEANEQKESKVKESKVKEKRDGEIISGKPKSTLKIPDDEWLESLKKSPAYEGVDIHREIEKAKLWLTLPKNQNRELTRQFIVNWLNRADKTMGTPQTKPPEKVLDYWDKVEIEQNERKIRDKGKTQDQIDRENKERREAALCANSVNGSKPK